MFKAIWIFALPFFVITAAIAGDDETAAELEYLIAETERSARTNQLAAERVLFATGQAIDAASFIVSSVRVDRLIHVELRRLASRIPGVRAIIVIGPDGQLRHDSYKFPTTKLDLADRSYFKEALSTSDLVIGKQVIGRTSGTNFVPIVKRIGDLTFVAVTAPYAIVDLQSECGDCWSLALQPDGTIVSMFPPETDFMPQLIKRTAHSMASSGSTIVRFRHSIFSVAWRKSPDFPLISVSVRGLPDTATVDVDVN